MKEDDFIELAATVWINTSIKMNEECTTFEEDLYKSILDETKNRTSESFIDKFEDKVFELTGMDYEELLTKEILSEMYNTGE
jgi:hypothetical protein